MKPPIPKLSEIAARIGKHLKAAEAAEKADPASQAPGYTARFYSPGAIASGSRVGIIYRSFQGISYLSKAEAIAYLAYLDKSPRTVLNHYHVNLKRPVPRP